jgi:hypothetical protein
MAAHQISDEIRSNFHLFYDNFPFPVMLVHKDRTILAMNKTAETVGYQTGIRCIDMGQKEHHKACLANKALSEQTATRLVAYFDFAGAVLDSYWIPLAGSDELFVHYAADITQWAAESLRPKQGDAGAGCATCNCG